jgi:GDP-L-fucose synthase
MMERPIVFMRPQDRIYVAGHRGLAGSAIVRRLRAGGYANLALRTHAELDLTRQDDVEAFFAEERPSHVFLAAAKVGGILANNTYRADFIYHNLAIQNNVIQAAHRSGVAKLLFLGSSCIYPKLAPQPMREEHLLTGPLEPTNEPYAIAKIAGIKLCAAYNAQYGTDFMAVMPTNLYGPGDNYDLAASHVLPALLRKAHEAKIAGARQMTVWGSGTPLREFLYSDDLADACVFLMERCTARDLGEFINVGTGEEHSITEIARAVAKVVGFDGELVFDPGKPDGTPRKVMDVSRINRLGWSPSTTFIRGIELAYRDFTDRYSSIAAAA